MKDVAGLARLGFPIGIVTEDGDIEITKVPGSGGQVTLATCKEQLLYEVHDPARYLQPDVVADFFRGGDGGARPRPVRVTGGRGAPGDRPPQGLGRADRFVCRRGPDLLCRPGATARGRLALDIVRERLESPGSRASESALRLIGVDSLHVRVSPETPSPTRSASASPGAATAWVRRRGSATRSRRSTPTARPAAAAPGNRPARWSAWSRCWCRASLARPSVRMFEA